MVVHQYAERRKPYPGRGDALQTLTSSGTPLLAGFSITMIGVVAQAPDRFSAPSVTILLLTIAAIAFAISIHCYYWARIHQVASVDLPETSNGPTSPDLDLIRDHFAHLAWARRLRVCFQGGILLLFVGPATAVWPVSGEQDPGPRIAAVACCAAMTVLVLFWTFGFFFLRLVAAAERGAKVSRAILWWFRPGGRAYEAHIAQTGREALPEQPAIAPPMREPLR